jgi:hypothetical protein
MEKPVRFDFRICPAKSTLTDFSEFQVSFRCGLHISPARATIIGAEVHQVKQTAFALQAYDKAAAAFVGQGLVIVQCGLADGRTVTATQTDAAFGKTGFALCSGKAAVARLQSLQHNPGFQFGQLPAG